MSKINLSIYKDAYKKATAEAPSKEPKVEVPDGIYNGKIIEAGAEETRLNKKPYILFVIMITDGAFKGQKLYKKIFLSSQYGVNDLKRDMTYLGVGDKDIDEVDFVDLVGEKVVVEQKTADTVKAGFTKPFQNYRFMPKEEAKPAAVETKKKAKAKAEPEAEVVDLDDLIFEE